MHNPFLPGISRSGYQVVMEPLFYYNAYHTDTVCGPPGIDCKDGEMPWIGTAYKFSDDFKSVTVNLRKGVEWSDGQPFTAKDVVFTVQMLIDNAPKLAWSADMKQWVKSVSAPDDNTVQFTLTDANPRFIFSYFTFHQDVGVFIVPEHIFKGQDATKFTNLDLAKGLAGRHWPVQAGVLRPATEDLGSAGRLVGDQDRLPSPARARADDLPAGLRRGQAGRAADQQRGRLRPVDAARQHQSRHGPQPQDRQLERQGSAVRLRRLVADRARLQRHEGAVQRSRHSPRHQQRAQPRRDRQDRLPGRGREDGRCPTRLPGAERVHQRSSPTCCSSTRSTTSTSTRARR